MRLDKYLKVSRLIKRRTVANEACDTGRIFCNGVAVKASYQVKVDDILEIRLGNRVTKVKVTNVSEIATKETAPTLYTVLED